VCALPGLRFGSCDGGERRASGRADIDAFEQSQPPSNRQIARTLFRSVSTVATHLRNIFAKIAVENRTEAAAFALRNRLLGD